MDNTILYERRIVFGKDEKGNGLVHYNCQKCNHRNTHRWFGSEVHYCSNCDATTAIRGSVGTKS